MRVSGSKQLMKAAMPQGGVMAVEPFGANALDLRKMGWDTESTIQEVNRASRLASTVSIENAERPTNFWYRVTGQTSYWYMYAYMDWLKSEVSILSTIILRATTEIFKYGLEFVAKFALKCEDCGCEIGDHFDGHDTIPASAIAKRSKERYGRILCVKCARAELKKEK